MKDNKHIQKFNEHQENLNISDVSVSDNLDLSIELEYKLRNTDDTSNLTVDDFLAEFGIKEGEMTGFAWASILKNKSKYEKMGDEEFFDLYKKYKSEL